MAFDKIVQRSCLSFEWTFSYLEFSAIVEIKGDSYCSPDFECFGAKFCFEIRTDLKRVVVYLRKYGLGNASRGLNIILGLRTFEKIDCKAGVYDLGQKFSFGECLLVPTEVFDPKDTVAAERNLTIFCTVYPSESCSTEESASRELCIEDEDLNKTHSCTEDVQTGCTNNQAVQTGSQSIPKGTATLIKNLKDLLLTGKDSDVTVAVQGDPFRLHRAILGIRSPVFASMLEHDMAEKNTGVVTIPDLSPEGFRQFVSYLYSGQVDAFTPDSAFCVYRAADKYDVPDLKSESLDFIKSNLSVDTICDVIRLSLQHDERELLKLATQFFVSNLTGVIKSVGWQLFLEENPTAANELYIKAADSR